MSINVRHDGKVWISVGRSRREKSWKSKSLKWSELAEKLSKNIKTAETYKEYIEMDKPMQSEKKDVGGFVGGVISSGRRLQKNVSNRYLLTLDIDFGKTDFWEDFQMIYGNAALIYSTHKHSPESPRYRLVAPLSREVFPDEYEAIARYIAGILGIDLFDPTTFQPERLMYWPSTSKDRELYYEFQDGPWIDADRILAQYSDWTDVSQWPMSGLAKARIKKAADKQGDPTEKPGVIGAFNRCYTISGAIAAYLELEYTATDDPTRYTYTGGSTGAGLVLYDDQFAFSHHSTDPVSGMLCNAFDLVRIHKFLDQDENMPLDTPVNRRPSHVAMSEFALKDKTVSKEMSLQRLKEAGYDFADIDKEEMTWIENLSMDTRGNILSVSPNFLQILRHDPYLKDCFGNNAFAGMEIARKDLPWRSIKRSGDFLEDGDDSELRTYVEKNYSIYNKAKLDDAFACLMVETSFHPVRDYLNGLTWDEQRRIDTLLIDYFGAEDNAYTRMVTRKTLIAAVARVFKPGIDFHEMLTLIGRQGCGKSTLFAKLGRQWYSDSLGALDKKDAMEALQGAWIIEMGELSAIKRSDIEVVKHFLAKKEDRYRKAYGRRLSYMARQCVFVGTTNKSDYLIDDTGNRRFWSVELYVTEPVKSVFADLTPGEVNQIWAEAMTLFQGGEVLRLTPEVEKTAKDVQMRHMEKDPREELIAEYLEKEIPENWYDLSLYDKREHLNNDDTELAETVKRQKVTPLEIYLELFDGRLKDANYTVLKPIRSTLRGLKNWEEKVVKTGKKSVRGFYRKGG